MQEQFWEEARAQINARARIDLSCPDVHAELVERQGRYPVEVSAHGCGRSALYHRALRRHFGRFTTKNTEWEAVAMSQPVEHPTQPMPSSALDNEIPPQPY